MPLIDSLERKYGHLAIPHLIAGIAILQGLVWFLLRSSPYFVSSVSFSSAAIIHNHEFWRLITWVFVPRQSMTVWMIISIIFNFIISQGLEHAWGSFRITCFIIGGIILIDALSLTFGASPSSIAFNSAIFLAYAYFFPDVEFRVYFFVPVKTRYLAWLSVATVAVLSTQRDGDGRLGILFSYFPYLIAFGPALWRNLMKESANTERRAKFVAARPDEGTHFHKCDSCGKTDVDNPLLEFRVTADGDEYCSECRPLPKVQG